MNGIINVYKERGFTSFDVVAKLRGILHERKIGHTGTLDPEAAGVLPVCVGNATKVCEFLTEKDKTYEAVLHLGITTDTGDLTGKVLSDKTEQAGLLSEKEIEDAVMGFVGSYAQVPPMYSARKVDGKRLYELARAGIEIERKAVNVSIYSIQILDTRVPYVRFLVRCSKGTYIRTLCEDIGKKLGTGGCMEKLKRTQSGIFKEDSAHTLSEIEKIQAEGKISELLIPVDALFPEYPKLHIKKEALKLLQNGNKLLPEAFVEEDRCRMDSKALVYDTAGRFYAIYEYDKTFGYYKVKKMFGAEKL